MPSIWTNNRGLLAATAGVGILVTLWAFSGAFVSAQTRDCISRYDAARSAADSAAVDSLVPSAPYKSHDTRTCGVRRMNARWFAKH